jgi:hypothetical protein
MFNLFHIFEIKNGAIILREHEKLFVTIGSPLVMAWGSSSPRVMAWDSSSPRVMAHDSSAPQVEAWDSSAPRVVERGQNKINLILFGNEVGRGYARSLTFYDKRLLFRAGCHQFTLTEARQHWGSPEYPDLERGDQYLRLIDFAEREAIARGWVK